MVPVRISEASYKASYIVLHNIAPVIDVLAEPFSSFILGNTNF